MQSKNDVLAVKNGLDATYSSNLGKALNVYLANLHVMYMKVRNFHWNVIGVDFFDFHKYLEKMYNKLADEIDRVAERIKMLGLFPVGSLKECLELATLKEVPSIHYNTVTISMELINDFSTTARYLRQILTHINETTDEFTSNMLGESLEFIEKQVWFFSAYTTRSQNEES
ncbi:MAG: Dps family protein [Bacilli bacterium]